MGPVRLSIASLARGLVGVNGFGCLNVILLVVVKGLCLRSSNVAAPAG